MKVLEYREVDGLEVEVWTDDHESANLVGLVIELLGIVILGYACIVYIFPLIISRGT